jgi:cytochrome c556
MNSLGREMQTTTDAISKEDWARVAETAQKIAHHAEPPASEKKLILGWLGSNSELFEELDERTHEAARAMAKAAESGDGQKVIESFAKLQNGCLACHQRFRKAFVEHFYAQDR